MPTKTMRSRLTGKLQTYVLTEELITCDRFQVDMTELKNSIQAEYDLKSVDAQVEKCKHIRAGTYDYLILDTWAAAEVPALGDPIITPALIMFMVKAILAVLAYAAIVVITYFAAIGMKQVLWPTPKYYCSICGEGPFETVAELTAHRREFHPDAAAHQCPYCGQAFATIEQLNAHVEECPWRPKELPEWVPYAIVGIGIIAAIIIVPKVIDYIKKPS
ncbi:hypothetical protein ES702_00754 [subsurface metagenome]